MQRQRINNKSLDLSKQSETFPYLIGQLKETKQIH
jgi:hypothetical protein